MLGGGGAVKAARAERSLVLLALRVLLHQPDEVRHAAVRFEGVTEVGGDLDRVVGPTAAPLAHQHVTGLQLSEDALHGTLRDAHLRRDVSDACVWVAGDAE